MTNSLQPPIHAGSAVQFGIFDLSTADLTVIGLMIVVFILALIIPFPGGRDKK